MKDGTLAQHSSRYYSRFDNERNPVNNSFGRAMPYGSSTKKISSHEPSSGLEPIDPRKKTWNRKSICIVFGGAVLIVLTISYLYSTLSPLIWSHGSTKSLNPPHSFDLSSCIGFQLTPSYGISAIRYPNGTFSNLARVDFTTETVDRQPESFYHMMQRLAEPKSYRDP